MEIEESCNLACFQAESKRSKAMNPSFTGFNNGGERIVEDTVLNGIKY